MSYYSNDPDCIPPRDTTNDEDVAYDRYRNSPEFEEDRIRALFLGNRTAEILADSIKSGVIMSPRDALNVAKLEWEDAIAG